MIQSTIFSVLLAAPPPGCGEDVIRTSFRRSDYAGVVELSRRCFKHSGDAYYKFAAAQAYFYMQDYPRARDALTQYFAGTDLSGDHGESARSLQTEIRDALARTPKPAPRPATPSRPKQPEPTPAPASITVPEVVPAAIGPADQQPMASSANTVPEAQPDEQPKPTPLPVVPPEPNPTLPERPDFRRGWIGLGISAGVLTAGSVALGMAGGLVARDAFRTNTDALRAYGIDPDFDPTTCDDLGSAACGVRELEERGYSSANYHSDLAFSSRLLSAAGITGGAALGSLIGAAPIRAATPRRRRAGFIGILTGGVLVTAGSAAFFGLSRQRLGDALQGLDQGGPWRASRTDFMRLEGASMAAATLIGVGAGALIGVGIGAITEWGPVRKNRRQAQLQVSPGLGSLSLVGRF